MTLSLQQNDLFHHVAVSVNSSRIVKNAREKKNPLHSFLSPYLGNIGNTNKRNCFEDRCEQIMLIPEMK